ncbi:hypothetical protein LX15_003262 [Streptoalloteichus tenebrarius]|uniref:Uncharacterized protein n=1 Tax=Streptoalloteichus tenebrarius (strain ATCC 17920 / DSM 40477 / JCM 4838 / CBS 697.72 / NBRC 16177 / NCIMB 11028 / NRRL B-12390 / A12253. 1 / ISP 5477) TaxID=1933 RepID=A0ABT1HVM5_STRSD|nr:hypothetical protein [Streptoalloteichus tenebrarius]
MAVDGAIRAGPEDPALPASGERAARDRPVVILAGPGGPALRPECTRSRRGQRVAILTKPERPALLADVGARPVPDRVAILAGPERPALPGRRAPCAHQGPGCDPRRPPRAGAAGTAFAEVTMIGALRASPPPKSRRCADPQPARVRRPHVAMLAGPERPAPPGVAGCRVADPVVAFLAGPPKGRRCARTPAGVARPRRCCDPRRTPGVADASASHAASSTTTGVRSSPGLRGRRCSSADSRSAHISVLRSSPDPKDPRCTRHPQPRPNPRRRCDPRRP